MTICLAAICRDNERDYAVVAADRMVTLGGFIEFEHGVPKMAHPSAQAVVMVAGDTLIGTRLAREVSAALDGTVPRTPGIARELATKYLEIRTVAIENQVLAPRGLNLQAFYGAHQSLNPQITMMIDQSMSQFNLGVELLLAGVDQDGAHIFSIHNPGGGELQHDVIGYAAVGSGAIHAIQSMIGFQHNSSCELGETIFRAYASKRRAEVAPGVGQETDIAVVSLDGVRWLTKENKDRLAVLYETYQATASSTLAEKLSELELAEHGPEVDIDGAGADGG
jgi:hypothetical protein